MLLPYNEFTNITPDAAVVFPPSNWNPVLKLLGLIIVADGKTLKEEVDAFLAAVEELHVLVDPSVSLTPHMALDWFMLNRESLEGIIDSLAYDTALCEILSPIKSMPHKIDVIACMVAIAHADGEYAPIEKGLIEKTGLYWNVTARQ